MYSLNEGSAINTMMMTVTYPDTKRTSVV